MFDFTSKERDISGQLKQSSRHLHIAGSLSFPVAKEVVRQPPGSYVLLLTHPLCEKVVEEYFIWSLGKPRED